MVTDQDIERFFCKALELVKESGVVVQRAIGEGKQIEMKSEFTDLVTQYDRQVEQLLIGKLREEYPNHKFPVVAVSVALAVQKEIVVGIVYNPALDKMYTAVKGHGSFCNGTRLSVSGQNDISKALIISEVGSSRDPGHMQFVFRNMHNLMQKAQGLRCLGSTAVNMCFVASGEADAFYEFGMHVWDMAAAALIVTEAGGVVMDTQGGPLNLMHRRVLCASSHALASTISQILEHVQLESD
ncbi:inositol monophosphatase 2 isoform X3 [Rhipicephalus microplus]|uniref:inositol monophosphatase 2 isoform X3 n=1 Tax=Rhipicephalus microplus TaxID=6941 RepID=UPI0023769037